jgi:hypothetical protein
VKNSATVDDLDLSELPEHLHEWARNLEEQANQYQRDAEEMEKQVRVLAITFLQ